MTDNNENNKPFYEGDVSIVFLDLIKTSFGETSNPNFSHTYSTKISNRGFLSMFYIVSKVKPEKVELTLNDQIFGSCEGDNIRQVDTYNRFEEFNEESGFPKVHIPIFEEMYYNYEKVIKDFNVYKIILYGKDGKFNCRNGKDTESYAFPLYKLRYMEPRVNVYFSSKNDELSNFLYTNSPLLISEFINTDNEPFDMISIVGKDKTVLRVSDGAIGNLLPINPTIQAYIDSYQPLKIGY